MTPQLSQGIASEISPLDLGRLMTNEKTYGMVAASSKGKLAQVFKSTLKKRYNIDTEKKLTPYFWDENYHHLKNTTLYQRLAQPERKILLSKMSNDILNTVHYVEKLGLAIFSKLSLLAESTEERILHSLIVGDEARHLSLITRYLENEPTDQYKKSMFLTYLGDAVQVSNRSQLLYIVQVFMEGAGVSLYQELLDHVNDQDIKQVFKDILNDETYHQNAGRALFQETELTSEDTRFLIERAATLIELIKNDIGMTLVRHFTEVHGQLFANEIEELFIQANVVLRTENKLAPLFQAMRANDKNKIHQSLQDMGILSYPTLDELMENITVGIPNL